MATDAIAPRSLLSGGEGCSEILVVALLESAEAGGKDLEVRPERQTS